MQARPFSSKPPRSGLFVPIATRASCTGTGAPTAPGRPRPHRPDLGLGSGQGALTLAQLHQHLLPRLERDVLPVSDGHPAYRAFARQTGIIHEAVTLNAGIRVRGAIHVQNVNSYHSRLRGWLLPFRGVASRYLTNYLGWRWALDGGRIGTPEGMLRAALGIGRQAGFHT